MAIANQPPGGFGTGQQPPLLMPPGWRGQAPGGQAPPPGGQGVPPPNYLNPWLPSVTAGMNGQPVAFATPDRPNPNYVTPEAAGAVAKTMGANVVSQNMTGMSSPGSPAPSAPMYGLDFGRGDVQGADVGVTGFARGDSPESIAARYQAGLNTRAFAGAPPPVTNPADNTFWNRTTPVQTNTPTPAQAGFFAAPPPTTPPPRPPATGLQGLPPQVVQMLAQAGVQGIPPGGLGGFFT